MEPNRAAAKAFSLVNNRNKKVYVCFPKDKVTHVSSNKSLPGLNINSIPPTSSGSTKSISRKSSHSTNSDFNEPMETTDSFDSILIDKSRSSCDSAAAASSCLVQMNSSSSSVQMEDAAPQHVLDIPSDIGASSSSNGEVESIGEHYTHRSGMMVSQILPSALCSGDVMDISPSVQSGPTISLFHPHSPVPKDTLFTTFSGQRITSNFNRGLCVVFMA